MAANPLRNAALSAAITGSSMAARLLPAPGGRSVVHGTARPGGCDEAGARGTERARRKADGGAPVRVVVFFHLSLYGADVPPVRGARRLRSRPADVPRGREEGARREPRRSRAGDRADLWRRER